MIKIYPSVFQGTVKAPASKAHAQRLLFMASMPIKPTVIKNVPECSDIDVTIDCLEELGCKVTRSGGCSVKVEPFPKNIPVQTADFNFKESSTSARIAVAMCAALGIRADCKAIGSLHKRKLLPLTTRMALRGAKFTGFSLPFTMTGRLEPGEYIFGGDEGSQNISAMLMALPLVRDDSTIRLTGPLQDSSFIDLTVEALDKFGIKVEKQPDGFYIPGKQYYQSPGSVETENDWGLASLWITAGASSGARSKGVTVTDLPVNSPQLYRQIKPYLALLSFDFQEMEIDASKSPDLATVFAALAIVKGATVKIKGVPQLKFKESDRLSVMAEIARHFGQSAVTTADGISVIGNGRPTYIDGTVIDCQGDPWVFMSMAVAAATLKYPIILSDEHCADKIYADFLRDFAALGGIYQTGEF